MATNTTNYSLTKPAYTDTADIADINGNMDTVDSALTKLCNDLAIVEFGNNSTHSISNGSFVVWKGDLYVANQNISNGAALSGKLTAVANGGLNNLNNLYNTLNSNLTNFVKYKSVTATTTSSGAVAIPSDIGANRILSAQYTDGKTGLIYKRDQSYFTCVDNSFSPYSTVSVTFNIIYLNNAPVLGS